MTRNLFRTKRKICAAVQALFLAASTGASAAIADAPNAGSFIQQAFDKSFADLDNASLGASERQQRFHEAVLNLIDVRNTAHYTLGNFAAEASSGDVDAFTRAFREYAAASYAQQLGGEAHSALKVTGLQSAKDGDVLVTAMLARPHAEAKTITFRVRRVSSTGLAVVDVRIDGIWLSLLERADFSSFLHRNSGSVAKLTDEINKIEENIRTSRQG
jgi:ABC-type transporter MlaC component